MRVGSHTLRVEGGCIHPSLEGNKRLFPNIQCNCFLHDKIFQGGSSPCDPLLAESTLVPLHTEIINRPTPSSSTTSGLLDFLFEREASSSTDQASRFDALRRNFEERGLSEEAIALALSAIRTYSLIRWRI